MKGVINSNEHEIGQNKGSKKISCPDMEHGWDLEHDVLGCLVCRVVDGMMCYCRSSVYHPDHSLHQCPWDGSCGH